MHRTIQKQELIYQTELLISLFLISSNKFPFSVSVFLFPIFPFPFSVSLLSYTLYNLLFIGKRLRSFRQNFVYISKSVPMTVYVIGLWNSDVAVGSAI